MARIVKIKAISFEFLKKKITYKNIKKIKILVMNQAFFWRKTSSHKENILTLKYTMDGKIINL